MGWKPDLTYVIRHDSQSGTLYPFPYSPPEAPPPVGVSTSPSSGHSSTFTRKITRKGNGPMEVSSPDVSKNTEILNISQRESHIADPVQLPDTASTVDTVLTFLTIHAQKAGANSPSLAHVITMLNDHSPDILFVTEAPLHTHSTGL